MISASTVMGFPISPADENWRITARGKVTITVETPSCYHLEMTPSGLAVVARGNLHISRAKLAPYQLYVETSDSLSSWLPSVSRRGEEEGSRLVTGGFGK